MVTYERRNLDADVQFAPASCGPTPPTPEVSREVRGRVAIFCSSDEILEKAVNRCPGETVETRVVEVIPEKIETSLDSADEGLVGMLPHFAHREALIGDSNGFPQLPPGRGEEDPVVHKAKVKQAVPVREMGKSLVHLREIDRPKERRQRRAPPDAASGAAVVSRPVEGAIKKARDETQQGRIRNDPVQRVKHFGVVQTFIIVVDVRSKDKAVGATRQGSVQFAHNSLGATSAPEMETARAETSLQDRRKEQRDGLENHRIGGGPALDPFAVCARAKDLHRLETV